MARRPRHAAVKDVADNRNLQTFEGFLVAQNCVSIEQRLRGMLVQSISSVDDGHVDVLRHDVGRSGVGVGEEMTMMSAPTAPPVYPVSSSDSPFSMLEPAD